MYKSYSDSLDIDCASVSSQYWILSFKRSHFHVIYQKCQSSKFWKSTFDFCINFLFLPKSLDSFITLKLVWWLSYYDDQDILEKRLDDFCLRCWYNTRFDLSTHILICIIFILCILLLKLRWYWRITSSIKYFEQRTKCL